MQDAFLLAPVGEQAEAHEKGGECCNHALPLADAPLQFASFNLRHYLNISATFLLYRFSCSGTGRRSSLFIYHTIT